MKFYVVLIAHCICVTSLLTLLRYSLIIYAPHFFERLAFWVLFLVVTLFTFRFTRRRCLQDEVDVKGKAVLITGCDSGFGFLLAQRLDKKGFKVFASCLFPSGPGANELKQFLSDQSKVFGLDVRTQESIHHAFKFVKENLGPYELWAVVNNAGVRKGFSIEMSSVQDFEDCMDVNALGQVRVTKAFLNLLRTSKGRIINVNSVSARIPFADMIPYSMSKHAAVGFNDCLRAELNSTGIKVISIESTLYLSPMTEKDKNMENLEQKIAENEEEMIKNRGKSYIKNCKQFVAVFLSNVSKDVHIAINDIEHAVCFQYPESIYKTCPSIFREMYFKIKGLLPPFLQDWVCYTIPHILCKLHKL